jgi:hypothetical protein
MSDPLLNLDPRIEGLDVVDREIPDVARHDRLMVMQRRVPEPASLARLMIDDADFILRRENRIFDEPPRT